MTDELKACPFCGHSPAEEWHAYQNGTVDIGCRNPDCPMMNCNTGLLKPDQARSHWNTRPVEDALHIELDAANATFAFLRNENGKLRAQVDALTSENAKATEALGFSQSYWMQAIEERDILRAKREWIPVRIKPELRDTAYLCKIGPSPYYVQIRFFRLTGEWNDPNVISWMPLPEA